METNKIPRTGIERDEYIKKLNTLNEFDRLVENLCSCELTLTMLELAYNEYIRRMKFIPEGVANLLTPQNEMTRGLLTHCWKTIGATVGNMELAYRRGIQEGEEK